jgi:hypothetical protein
LVGSAVDIRSDGGDANRYLSTNEIAYQSLKENGCSVESLDSYLPDDGIDNITRRNVEIASSLCDRLDDLVHEEWPEVPEGCNPFDALCYQIKHVIDGLSFRFEALSTFLDDESPERLIATR